MRFEVRRPAHSVSELTDCYTYGSNRLPEIITKHSNKKPMMIFCCTRNSAISTAKELSKLWSNTVPNRRMWAGPVRVPVVKNPDLKGILKIAREQVLN